MQTSAPAILPDPVATPAPSPALGETPTPAPAPTPAPTTGTAAILERMRTALANGQALQVSQQAGISVTTQSSPSVANAVRIEPDDVRLRWLGGTVSRGMANKYVSSVMGQAATLADPSIISGTTGLPRWRIGLNNGVRFVLPAGVEEFEMVLGDGLARQNLMLLIDGVAIRADGYDSAQVMNGGLLYSHFTLPASQRDRTITVNFGGRPFFGINMSPGDDIAAVVPDAEPLSIIFVGDSITAGSVSTMTDKGWAMQAAYRLGIDNPIVSGVGGSGYLARFPTDIGYDFEDRIDDVRLGVDGHTPDAVFVAGGINDCGVAPGSPYSMAQVGAAALSYFRALRSLDAEMPIFVFGPFTGYNDPDYSQTSRQCRDAIFNAAGQVSGTYTIDVSTWVTSQNRDQVFDGTANGPHPTDSGHAIYGARAADAIARILTR